MGVFDQNVFKPSSVGKMRVFLTKMDSNQILWIGWMLSDQNVLKPPFITKHLEAFPSNLIGY